MHSFVPIDSNGEREQWYSCECGVHLPHSRVTELAQSPSSSGLCRVHDRPPEGRPT